MFLLQLSSSSHLRRVCVAIVALVDLPPPRVVAPPLLLFSFVVVVGKPQSGDLVPCRRRLILSPPPFVELAAAVRGSGNPSLVVVPTLRPLGYLQLFRPTVHVLRVFHVLSQLDLSVRRVFSALELLLLKGLFQFQFQTGFSARLNNYPQHRNPMFQTTCALFAGTWVRDDTYHPLYQYSNCPIIDAEFNCQMYGRPDSDYLKYRWQPLNCVLPRFDGLVFLSKMTGKHVMFVGDSLGRNQWESLICMVSASAPTVLTQMSRADPLSTFTFIDYGLSISFYRAPYLVDIDVVQGRRILKLEDISANGNAWRTADVLVFNTGHWWSHEGSLQGWDLIQAGGKYYKDIDRLVALEKGLRTWANWVDTNVDVTKTRVFFQSISPTHYDPSEWSAGATAIATKNCYGETAPMTGTTYRSTYPEQMRVADEVIREMHVPTYLLDITMLSELRKDGHPSVYSGDLSPDQRANPNRSADCSHWCLPGLPDTWNELFYTVLFY